MRALAFLLLCACGPSQQQIIETPAATITTRSEDAEAPPASTRDEVRYRVYRQFQDMETTQQAYREAGQSRRAEQNRKIEEVEHHLQKQKPKPPKAPVEPAPVEPAPVEKVLNSP